MVDGKESEEKVFINIVQSAKIAAPTKTAAAEGTCWSLPYCTGPPHMEKDKRGCNSAVFDCCFHPEALRMGAESRDFRDLLVSTGLDGVEQMYRTQSQQVALSRASHVVKGLRYKEGQVLTMMIPLAARDRWQDQPGLNPSDRQQSPASGPASSSSSPKKPAAATSVGTDSGAAVPAALPGSAPKVSSAIGSGSVATDCQRRLQQRPP